VFPVLLVVKAALLVFHVAEGDYLTVAFVALVLAFFVTFAALVLLRAFVGNPSKRFEREELSFTPPRTKDLEGAQMRALPRPELRVVGRVEAGLEPRAPVLVERWAKDGGRLVRMVEGCSFTVVPDEGPTAGVELTTTPVLLLGYDAPTGVALEAVTPLTQGATLDPVAECTLRQGDRIVLAAPAAEPATRVEDARLAGLLGAGGEAGPYRATESVGVVARGAPIVIRRAS
jgi:hypothetical protein